MSVSEPSSNSIHPISGDIQKAIGNVDEAYNIAGLDDKDIAAMQKVHAHVKNEGLRNELNDDLIIKLKAKLDKSIENYIEVKNLANPTSDESKIFKNALNKFFEFLGLATNSQKDREISELEALNELLEFQALVSGLAIQIKEENKKIQEGRQEGQGGGFPSPDGSSLAEEGEEVFAATDLLPTGSGEKIPATEGIARGAPPSPVSIAQNFETEAAEALVPFLAMPQESIPPTETEKIIEKTHDQEVLERRQAVLDASRQGRRHADKPLDSASSLQSEKSNLGRSDESATTDRAANSDKAFLEAIIRKKIAEAENKKQIEEAAKKEERPPSVQGESGLAGENESASADSELKQGELIQSKTGEPSQVREESLEESPEVVAQEVASLEKSADVSSELLTQKALKQREGALKELLSTEETFKKQLGIAYTFWSKWAESDPTNGRAQEISKCLEGIITHEENVFNKFRELNAKFEVNKELNVMDELKAVFEANEFGYYVKALSKFIPYYSEVTALGGIKQDDVERILVGNAKLDESSESSNYVLLNHAFITPVQRFPRYTLLDKEICESYGFKGDTQASTIPDELKSEIKKEQNEAEHKVLGYLDRLRPESGVIGTERQTTKKDLALQLANFSLQSEELPERLRKSVDSIRKSKTILGIMEAEKKSMTKDLEATEDNRKMKEIQKKLDQLTANIQVMKDFQAGSSFVGKLKQGLVSGGQPKSAAAHSVDEPESSAPPLPSSDSAKGKNVLISQTQKNDLYNSTGISAKLSKQKSNKMLQKGGEHYSAIIRDFEKIGRSILLMTTSNNIEDLRQECDALIVKCEEYVSPKPDTGKSTNSLLLKKITSNPGSEARHALVGEIKEEIKGLVTRLQNMETNLNKEPPLEEPEASQRGESPDVPPKKNLVPPPLVSEMKGKIPPPPGPPPVRKQPPPPPPRSESSGVGVAMQPQESSLKVEVDKSNWIKGADGRLRPPEPPRPEPLKGALPQSLAEQNANKPAELENARPASPLVQTPAKKDMLEEINQARTMLRKVEIDPNTGKVMGQDTKKKIDPALQAILARRKHLKSEESDNEFDDV